MSSDNWHNINDFYWHDESDDNNDQSQESSYFDKEDEDELEQNEPRKEEAEVKLISGKWLPGQEGFQFNKKCIAQVKAKMLKKTLRKRVILDVFVIYDGEEEDLKYKVDLFLEDDGLGEAEVMLFYGEKYYSSLENNPDATCKHEEHRGLVKSP